MNSSVATIIATMRNASTQTAGQGLATIAEVVHEAFVAPADAHEQKRSELNRWLIAFAAIAGAFFVMRALRKLAGLVFGLFWIWLFVGGHMRHLHFW